jgi:hypothetical protein
MAPQKVVTMQATQQSLASAALGSSGSGAGLTTGLTTVDMSMAERVGEGPTVEDMSTMHTMGTV